mmetsp:Transcript_67955/g.215007  ORF Transcript_67955/g.215007 Transcript_67955/m.215007 type:complete len:276 (-) Transcript_67955:89-916(-)
MVRFPPEDLPLTSVQLWECPPTSSRASKSSTRLPPIASIQDAVRPLAPAPTTATGFELSKSALRTREDRSFVRRRRNTAPKPPTPPSTQSMAKYVSALPICSAFPQDLRRQHAMQKGAALNPRQTTMVSAEAITLTLLFHISAQKDMSITVGDANKMKPTKAWLSNHTAKIGLILLAQGCCAHSFVEPFSRSPSGTCTFLKASTRFDTSSELVHTVSSAVKTFGGGSSMDVPSSEAARSASCPCGTTFFSTGLLLLDLRFCGAGSASADIAEQTQ